MGAAAASDSPAVFLLGDIRTNPTLRLHGHKTAEHEKAPHRYEA